MLTGLCLPSIGKFSSRDLRTDRPAGPLNAARPAKGRAEPRLSRSQAAVQRRAEDARGAPGALPARCWAAGPPAPLRSRPQARLRPGPASCLPPRPPVGRGTIPVPRVPPYPLRRLPSAPLGSPERRRGRTERRPGRWKPMPAPAVNPRPTHILGARRQQRSDHVAHDWRSAGGKSLRVANSDDVTGRRGGGRWVGRLKGTGGGAPCCRAVAA